MKILLIEDDKLFARSLQTGLSPAYLVDLARTGQKGILKALTNEYHTLILDLNLPDISGLEICKELRREGLTLPMIILTGKIQVESKVVLLNAGADDYLTKPFSLAELKARLKAIQRRGQLITHNNIISVGALDLNLDTRLAFFKNKPLKLSKKEFLLLHLLMKTPDIVINRLHLFEYIWEGNLQICSNTVDVHISNLRRKIGRPLSNQLIKTAHGSGYVLNSTYAGSV